MVTYLGIRESMSANSFLCQTNKHPLCAISPLVSNETKDGLLQVECFLREKGELLFEGFLILQSKGAKVDRTASIS